MSAAVITAEIGDPDYIFQRETQRPHLHSPEFRVVKAIDGHMYAVFADEWAAYEFDLVNPHYFAYCPLASCGGRLNAYDLGPPQ